jgi:predicted DCC family thiol-disulfide oxidoreductase YuxK
MKVYYNESCSICRAEINHYKKQNIEEIDWVDITNNDVAEKETLKDDKTLLRRLHVKKDGKIFSGAKAFLLIWKNIPKYKFLYLILRLPLIFQIFSITYEVVAFLLYLKNKKQIKTN